MLESGARRKGRVWGGDRMAEKEYCSGEVESGPRRKRCGEKGWVGGGRSVDEESGKEGWRESKISGREERKI